MIATRPVSSPTPAPRILGAGRGAPRSAQDGRQGGHGVKLTRKQEQAIAALIEHGTAKMAAEAVGVHRHTLTKWQRLTAFQHAYREVRRAIVEASLARTQNLAIQAVATLERNMSSGVPAVEVSAARAIIEHAVKGIELIDVIERVDELEQASAMHAQAIGGLR